MSNKLGLRGAAIAAMLMALPAMAAAQNYPPGGGPGGPGVAPAGPQRDAQGFWQRRGLYGGVGIGFGQLAYGDCDEGDGFSCSWGGFGFHGDVGWHLSPQLGIFLDADFVGVNPTDGDFDVLLIQYVGTFGAQFWITPPLWIKAGIGSAQQAFGGDDTNCDVDDCTSDTAAAILLAGGYEILSSPNFSIDAQLRVGAGFYEEYYGGTVTNVSLQFSINWHSLFSGAMIIIH